MTDTVPFHSNLADINAMGRPDRRRLKKYLGKIDQYRESRFTQPPLVMIEPVRNPRAVQYDSELDMLVERPYTPQELMERAIERKEARSPKLDMHGNLLQHARTPKRSIHDRQIKKFWARLCADHQHALVAQLGISPKYKGGGYNHDTTQYDVMVKEYLKKYPRPTLEDAKEIYVDITSGKHH
jgi:hypothetical protein